MKALRAIMGDRAAAGPLVALFACLLVFQTFVASFTCALMPPAAVGVSSVICHDTARVSVRPAAPEPRRDHCPCGICCMAAPGLLAAFAPGADLGTAYVPVDVPVRAFSENQIVGPDRLDGLPPDPRGPPLFSA